MGTFQLYVIIPTCPAHLSAMKTVFVSFYIMFIHALSFLSFYPSFYHFVCRTLPFYDSPEFLQVFDNFRWVVPGFCTQAEPMRNLIRKDEADGFVATKTGKRW
jgi:Ni,Fe-hydrogenase I small subunit